MWSQKSSWFACKKVIEQHFCLYICEVLPCACARGYYACAMGPGYSDFTIQILEITEDLDYTCVLREAEKYIHRAEGSNIVTSRCVKVSAYP